MAPRRTAKAPQPPSRRGGPVITEAEIAFCQYLMTTDGQGRRRTFEQCAELAGVATDDAAALADSGRVRDYCDAYWRELARQMACQEAMRRADYELSPMAIAGELFFLLKHGTDERARVAAGSKLLDWLGPLEDRMKRATTDDLRYFAEHGHWPEERRLPAPRPSVQPPPAATATVDVEVIGKDGLRQDAPAPASRFDF